jgi:hypothetical protein
MFAAKHFHFDQGTNISEARWEQGTVLSECYMQHHLRKATDILLLSFVDSVETYLKQNRNES